MRLAATLAWMGLVLALAPLAGAEDKTAASGESSPKPGIDMQEVQRQNRAVEARLQREQDEEAKRYVQAQERLRVEGDSNACVALHNQRGTCLLTVSAFNNFTRSVEPDGDISEERLKQIRIAILKETLHADFLQDRLESTGMGKKVMEMGVAREKQYWAGMVKTIGEKKLRALYRQYREFFLAHEDRSYDVLASTDSSLIDSLSRLTGKAGKLADLPWVRMDDSLLPASLAEAGKKLRKWRCSQPLAWVGGSAILRAADIRKTPEAGFEDAVPCLVGMLSYQPLDSARAEKEALQYYKAHPKEFAIPDTLALDARLAPGIEPDPARLQTIASRRIASTDLPPQERRWLESHDSLRAGKKIAPLSAGLGMWEFRVLDVKKGSAGKGGGSFAMERANLVARLARMRASGALHAVLAEVYKKRSDVGMYIFQDLLDKSRAPTPEEIAQAEADTTKIELPPDLDEEHRKQVMDRMASVRIRDEKRDQDFDSWLNHYITLKGI